MLCPVLYLPVPVKFERWKCAPCLLVQKKSHSGTTSLDMALRCNRNRMYVYLLYSCNITYLKKRIEGTLCPVVNLPIPTGRSRLPDRYLHTLLHGTENKLLWRKIARYDSRIAQKLFTYVPKLYL